MRYAAQVIRGKTPTITKCFMSKTNPKQVVRDMCLLEKGKQGDCIINVVNGEGQYWRYLVMNNPSSTDVRIIDKSNLYVDDITLRRMLSGNIYIHEVVGI